MAPGILAETGIVPDNLPTKSWNQNQQQYGNYHPIESEELSLESNFGPMHSGTVGYLQPTVADTPIEIMHERFKRDGYLFVKQLLPKDPVLQCRRAYFSHMSPSGLLQPDSDPVIGKYCGADTRKYLPPGNLRRLFGLKNDIESDKYVELMVSAHEAEFYTKLCEISELREFVRKFTGWEKEIMLQRSMLRAFVPNSELTPVHYDQMYLRGGPPTSLTAWVPIGDVSLEGGGLMYLEKSDDIGRATEEEFACKAGNLSDEERISAFNKNMNDGGFLSRDTIEYGKQMQRKWLIAEYEAGDVIFHSPFMV
jgi:phytanoyl-CoA hydroxylase